MRWQDKPIRHPGPSSPTENICDRTTVRAFVAPMRFLRGKSDIRTDRAQGNPGERFQYAASNAGCKIAAKIRKN
jgi:hypothetical protein